MSDALDGRKRAVLKIIEKKEDQYGYIVEVAPTNAGAGGSLLFPVTEEFFNVLKVGQLFEITPLRKKQ